MMLRISGMGWSDAYRAQVLHPRLRASNVAFQTRNLANGISDFNPDLQIGAGVGIGVAKRLSLSLMPAFRINLTPVVYRSKLSTTIGTFSLNTGLVYHFRGWRLWGNLSQWPILLPKMAVMRFLLPVILLVLPLGAAAQKNPLQKLMRRNAGRLGEVFKHPDLYEAQVIYTQIDRDEHNRPHFRTSTWHLDESRYFYPASTIKMPIAIMALEKMNRLSIIGLDKHSTMITGQGHPPQTAAETDSTSATGLPSLGHYAKKVFMVSDNDANNRLYEFVGQKALNEGLREKGYRNTRLVHRLSASGFDETANRYTNPVTFYNGEQLRYHQGEVFSQAPTIPALKGQLKGIGYYSSGELVNEPFDFSKKNFISLKVLHDVLQAVLFPDAVPPARRFDLSEDDYRFLYQVMSELPSESRYPDYSGKPDHYAKFFLYGDRQDSDRMPDHVRIFNKVGSAYGYLTDVAYVVDFEAKVEFLLAATIHVNNNGIFNDDQYEYTTVGLPFLAELGRVVYEHELKRKRKYHPDLSRFQLERYD